MLHPTACSIGSGGGDDDGGTGDFEVDSVTKKSLVRFPPKAKILIVCFCYNDKGRISIKKLLNNSR